MNRWIIVLTGVTLAHLGINGTVWSMPYYAQPPSTFREAAACSQVVLFGTLANPQHGPDGDCTELRIEAMVKSDPILKDTKTIRIPRYVPIDPEKPKILVFCEVHKGQLDPYRGVCVKSKAIVDYLSKVTRLDSKDPSNALLLCFNYLDHPEAELADDAFLEFTRATNKELFAIAPRFAPDKLRKWIQDRRTPPYRLGLYGQLLGGCGTEQDATLLRSLLDNPKGCKLGNDGGILSGYIRLRPQAGWQLAESLIADTSLPFQERYAVVRALQCCHECRPSETKWLLRCIQIVLTQSDMADLAIDDLRRWQMWGLTDGVIGLYGKKSHSNPIVQRAILRYALRCPRTRASKLLKRVYKENPELLTDLYEWQQLEEEYYDLILGSRQCPASHIRHQLDFPIMVPIAETTGEEKRG